MEVMRLGKDGSALERPSTVGWVYWGLTRHLAQTKMRVAAGGEQAQAEMSELLSAVYE